MAGISARAEASNPALVASESTGLGGTVRRAREPGKPCVSGTSVEAREGRMRRRVLFALWVVAIAAALVAPRSGAASGSERAAVAERDFDGDGFADLAIGALWEDVGPVDQAGALGVIHGSATGLGGALITWDHGTPGVPGEPDPLDHLSQALATGDLDGDGFADLAMGAPDDEVAGAMNAGSVTVLYGSATGLSSAGSQRWHEDVQGVPEVAEGNDNFGQALGAGDFDGDGFADLAIGAYRESVGAIEGAGAVIVLRGSAKGLSATGSRLFHQDRTGVPGNAADFDQFGQALAAGNLGRGRFDDLAIGVPNDEVDGTFGAGSVHVFYGSDGGLTATGSDLWDQGVLKGSVEISDNFGFSLATGNVGMGEKSDLVVGVPFEAVGDLNHAGAVNVIYGSPDGLIAEGNQQWHQDITGVGGTAERNDIFGTALAVGNLGGGVQEDLVVGVPGEDAGADGAGVVNVLYGSPSGVSTAGNEVLYQDTVGVMGTAETADTFGHSLAIGNFGKGPQQDLAVGVPGEDVGSIENAGAVNILYGSAAGVATQGNMLLTQDSDGSDDAAEPFDLFGRSLAST
jgi:hypothetical protein